MLLLACAKLLNSIVIFKFIVKVALVSVAERRIRILRYHKIHKTNSSPSTIFIGYLLLMKKLHITVRFSCFSHQLDFLEVKGLRWMLQYFWARLRFCRWKAFSRLVCVVLDYLTLYRCVEIVFVKMILVLDLKGCLK